MLFAALPLALSAPVRADEEHPVMTAVSPTLISGYIDTSTSLYLGGCPTSENRPSNDSITNATVLTGLRSFTAFDLNNATREPDEPFSACHTIWYKWTPEVSGQIRFSTEGFGQDPTAPAVLRNAQARLAESIFYPDGGIEYLDANLVIEGDRRGDSAVFLEVNSYYGVLWPMLVVFRQIAPNQLAYVTSGINPVFDAAANETIYVVIVDDIVQSGFLYATLTPRPANDDFEDALWIEDASQATLSGNFVAATLQPGEAGDAPSVWFRWKAPCHGTARLQGAGAIFKGDTLRNLTLVASHPATLEFFAEEGVEYSIAIYGDPTRTNYSLQFQGPTYRVWDAFAAQIFPENLIPRFFGLRGSTALLYEFVDEEWRCLQAETIVGRQVIFTRRPQASDIRVVTIDEVLPTPRVELRSSGNNTFTPILRGLPGQSCYVSSSADLMDWTPGQKYSLTTHSLRLPILNANAPVRFYRVSQ